jgi:hypothetical protein
VFLFTAVKHFFLLTADVVVVCRPQRKKEKHLGGIFGLLAGYVTIFTWILSVQGELDETR